MSHFLSNLEELLPIPDLQQVLAAPIRKLKHLGLLERLLQSSELTSRKPVAGPCVVALPRRFCAVVSLAHLHLGGLLCFQTAAWLTETTSLSEEFGQHMSEPVALKALLLHHRQLGNLSSCECNRSYEDKDAF